MKYFLIFKRKVNFIQIYMENTSLRNSIEVIGAKGKGRATEYHKTLKTMWTSWTHQSVQMKLLEEVHRSILRSPLGSGGNKMTPQWVDKTNCQLASNIRYASHNQISLDRHLAAGQSLQKDTVELKSTPGYAHI